MDHQSINKCITCAYKIIEEIDNTLKDIPKDTGASNRLLELREIVNSFALELREIVNSFAEGERKHRSEAIAAYKRTDTQIG